MELVLESLALLQEHFECAEFDAIGHQIQPKSLLEEPFIGHLFQIDLLNDSHNEILIGANFDVRAQIHQEAEVVGLTVDYEVRQQDLSHLGRSYFL